MKKFITQFNKSAQSVRMRASERRDLKERLVSYMEYHPLPQTVARENAEQYLSSDEFTVVNFNTTLVRRFSFIFVVVICVIVPSLAERAVPGDILYPFKVQVNEEVRGYLATGPYEKIEWETERLERRISEARFLAEAGRLTEEMEQEVADAVRAHSDAAQREIASIRESDAEEAAIAEITFDSALAIQSGLLSGEKPSATLRIGSSTEGIDEVNTILTAVSEARKNTNQFDNKTLSYERLSARVEEYTTIAQEYFNSISEVASEEDIKSIERRMDDIGRKIQAASELRTYEVATTSASSTNQTHDTPVSLLRSALSDTQKLIIFMSDIDVRTNVAIDTLLPVVPTEEEKMSLITQGMTTLRTDVRILEAIAEDIENDSLRKKITSGIAMITESISITNKALEEEKFDVALTHTAKSIEFLEELFVMVEDVSDVSAYREMLLDTTIDRTDTGTTTGEGTSTTTDGVSNLDKATTTASTSEDRVSS